MSDDTAARFADNLRRARADSGLSQTQLAKAAGISHSEIYRLEAGTREPRLGTLIKLGSAMGIDGADLLDGLGDNNSRPNSKPK
jgi:transcriptional regulator with XRE-family HTH domain